MSRGICKLVFTSVLLVLTGAWGAIEAKESNSTNASITLNQLPAQGIETYQLIHQGGPFPFGKDGVVFGNRERALPTAKRGYYREYTVRTPRSDGRGARRIVCGGQNTAPDACYYTADHYASFRKIVP